MKKRSLLRTLLFALCCMLLFLFPQTASAAAKPATPKISSVTVTFSSVKLTWKKAKNAKKYEIYRSSSKNGTYQKIATVSKTTYTNSKLQSNHTYYYKIRAVNGKAKSSFSSKKKTKTAKLSYDLSTYAGKNFLEYVKVLNQPYKIAGSDGSYESSGPYFTFATDPSSPVSARKITGIWMSAYRNKTSKYNIFGVKLGMTMTQARAAMEKQSGWTLYSTADNTLRYRNSKKDCVMISAQENNPQKVGVIDYLIY
jgi:hypothetical protein